MNCNFTERVSSLIDGELMPSEAREVERHLLTCGDCQQLRADFLNLRSQITGFETSLQTEVSNHALRKILSAERRVPAHGLQWSFGKAVAFASLLLVGALIGFILYQNSRPSGPEVSARVAVSDPTPVPSTTTKQQKQPEAEASPSPRKENEESTPPRKTPATPKRRLAPEPKPGEQFASIPDIPERVRSGDAETMTALHFEKSETLLRAFRNVRLKEPGSAVEVGYERKRAQQLVYQNMMLRREADARGDVQIESVLESLEPILLDIANLPDKPDEDAVKVIRARMERKNIVALLRVNSTALARALD